MANIHKILQIQSNVLDSMLSISEVIKNHTRGNFDQELNELLRLAIVFEKMQPKYIDLSLKGKDCL